MSERDIISAFSNACVKRGFSKKGKIFSRCIGDAIYQNISIDSSSCMRSDFASSIYTSRKMSFIRIGIWSLYSYLPSFFFTDRRYIGTFYPENLIGSQFNTNTFAGIGNEYEIMISSGFDILDSITTQERLIEVVCTLQRAQHGVELPHQFELCAPYILCDQKNEALGHLYGLYTMNWLNFHAINDKLKQCGLYEEYIKKENSFEQEMNHVTVLLRNVLSQNDKKIKAFIHDCLNENILLAQKNNIPFACNFSTKQFE